MTNADRADAPGAVAPAGGALSSAGTVGVLRALPAVVIGVLLLVLAIARWRLVSTLNVNWDELYFLSKIHSHARGEPLGALLTFHVHLFDFVRDVAANEIDQVMALRWVMLALAVVAGATVFLIGRALFDSVAGALFAVLAGQSFSLVMNHGSSARYDPVIVALFLVAAAAIVVRRGTLPAVVAGVALAGSLLVSIKAALYLPTLACLFACRLGGRDEPRRAVARDAAVFAVTAAASFALCFSLHEASLRPSSSSSSSSSSAAPSSSASSADLPSSSWATAPPSGATRDAAGSAGSPGLRDVLGGIASKVFVAKADIDDEPAFRDSLRANPAFWLMLAGGVAVTAAGALRRRDEARVRVRRAQLLCFALPLLAIAFYRNSFEYFFVSIIPPAALLAGAVFAAVQQRTSARPIVGVALASAFSAALAGSCVRWYVYNADDQVAVQRELVDAVHTAFPEPVTYLDRCSMIGSHRKVGPFMSTWTLTEYRRRGVPIMRELLRREQPRFLLANIESLQLDRPFERAGRSWQRLLPEDFATLRESFVPHWGPLWVAGKSIAIPADGGAVDVDIVIAGRYVVEVERAVVVDGQLVAPRATITLTEGRHRFALADAGAAEPGLVGASATLPATLRTAEARPPPATAPRNQRLFRPLRQRG